MNSGNSTTSGLYTVINTYRTFNILNGYPLQIEISALYNSPITNAFMTDVQMQIGMGYSNGGSAPTDGAYFSYSNQTFNCNVNFNGTVTTQTSTLTPPTIGVFHNYMIVFTNGSVEFWVDNILYANIPFTSTNGAATSSNNLPVLCRMINASTPTNYTQLVISNVAVTLGDMNSGKNWQSIMSSCGNCCSQYPNGNTLVGSTANYTRNTTPVANASLSAVSAAIGTGLGGQFAGLLQLTLGTDGIVCSFQVPNSNSINNRNLYITGFTLQSVVQTAIATNPVILMYTLAFGSTAVSLATTESATTKAPRRIPIGFDSFSSTAAVGTLGTLFNRTFNTPIFVQPSEYIQITAKNIASGLPATTSALLWVISFDGYFE